MIIGYCDNQMLWQITFYDNSYKQLLIQKYRKMLGYCDKLSIVISQDRHKTHNVREAL